MCSNFLPRPLTKELAVSRVIHRCFYRAVRAKHTQSFTQDRALYAKALGLTAKVNFLYYNILYSFYNIRSTWAFPLIISPDKARPMNGFEVAIERRKTAVESMY